MNDKYVDEVSELAYYGFRYYDKTSMTWTQSDPLYRFTPDIARSNPRRASLYTGDLNNPLRYIDPDGRDNRDLENEQKGYCIEHPESDQCGGKGTEEPVAKPNEKQVHSDADADKIESDLAFNPDGPGQLVIGATLGLSGGDTANATATEARRLAASIFGNKTTTGRNDDEDAVRHALASYMLTNELGVGRAKAAGDAHERSVPNARGERVMDLYNNHVGRQLATDPKNAHLPPVVVVLKALHDGKLMTGPLQMSSGSGQIGTVPQKTYPTFRSWIWDPYK